VQAKGTTQEGTAAGVAVLRYLLFVQIERTLWCHKVSWQEGGQGGSNKWWGLGALLVLLVGSVNDWGGPELGPPSECGSLGGSPYFM